MKRIPSDDQERVVQSRALPINFNSSEALRPSLQVRSPDLTHYTSLSMNPRSNTTFSGLLEELPITPAANSGLGAYQVSSRSAPCSAYVSPVSPQSPERFWSQLPSPQTPHTLSSDQQKHPFLRSNSVSRHTFVTSTRSDIDDSSENSGRGRSMSLTTPQSTDSISIASLLAGPRQERLNPPASKASSLKEHEWSQRAAFSMPPPSLPLRQANQFKEDDRITLGHRQSEPLKYLGGLVDDTITNSTLDGRWTQGSNYLHTGRDENPLPLPEFQWQAERVRRREDYLPDDPHDSRGQHLDRYDQSLRHVQTLDLRRSQEPGMS